MQVAQLEVLLDRLPLRLRQGTQLLLGLLWLAELACLSLVLEGRGED